MTSSRGVLALTAVAAVPAIAPSIAFAAGGLRFTSPPEFYGKGRVSSEYSEIKVSFSPDGTRVLSGSTNRPGGSGGDDLYAAPFDSATGRYGDAQDLGPRVNSTGDEWAPVVSPDGTTGFLYLSSYRSESSAGRLDIYRVEYRLEAAEPQPRNLSRGALKTEASF